MSRFAHSCAVALSLGLASALWGQATAGGGELLVFMRSAADLPRFAADLSLTPSYSLRSHPSAFVLRTTSPAADISKVLSIAQADRRVQSAYLNTVAGRVVPSFVPDDAYFHHDAPSSGWPGQWYLTNELTSGMDAHLQGAWNRGLTGAGVTIGIVDDGLQTTHPDLQPNYLASQSWDFGQNDSDPSPVYTSDNHGTAVAGVAAARGGNGIGITGAAPYGGLAGLRIDFQNLTPAMLVNATLYHSSGSDTSIKIKNHSYETIGPYATSQAEKDALATSTAAGTIHVYAAGNQRGSTGEDSNKQDRLTSPDAIAVTAMGSDGLYASYANFGACVFVTAPSSTNNGYGVTTTDRTGSDGYNTGSGSDTFPDLDYTSTFGGTSAAAPLVAGILALAKQAQPALNTRYAKQLLVRTSDMVDPTDTSATSDGGWKTNAAGFKFDQNYGFGRINADQLTQLAADTVGVTPLVTTTTGTVSVTGGAIPDNNPTGISRTFTIATTERLEEVTVWLNVSHQRRGQLEAYLTSPSGTRSRLMYRNSSITGFLNGWTFLSNAFWGESPAGVWTLTVADVISGYTGTWSKYSVTLYSGNLIGQWNGPAGGGSFSSAANWTANALPQGLYAEADFLGKNTAPATITLDSPTTLTKATFNSAQPYTLAGPSSLTLQATSGAQINVVAGSHTIAAPVTLKSNLTVSGGGSIALTGGLTNTTALNQGYIITKNDLGTLTISGVQSHGAGAALDGNAGTVNLNSDAGNPTAANLAVVVAGGQVKLGANQHLQNLALTGGKLDIAGHALTLTNSTATTSALTASIKAGDIMTSITTDANHGIGISSGADAIAHGNSTFNDGTISGTDVLIQYGWNGDLNMDGQVNYLDFGVIDNNYLTPPTTVTYATGDINLDGIINYLDYGMMDNAFLAQAAPHTTAAAMSGGAVPEPAAIGLLGLAALGVLARRRRSR